MPAIDKAPRGALLFCAAKTSKLRSNFSPYAKGMALTPAQKSARFRVRHADGRINTHLDPATVQAIGVIASHLGTTKKAVIEAAVTHFQGAAMFNPSQPISQTNHPAGVTNASEIAELAATQNAAISRHLDEREIQANGGVKAMDQKARVTAAFLHANQHRK